MMRRFVLKRILQMIPTVAGVILITFVLFNMVGGSPAALILGKNATARELENFDAQYGYDRPAIAGRWVPTRAVTPVTRPAAGGPVAPGNGESFIIPFNFDLKPETVYRWELVVRGAGSFVVNADGKPVADRAFSGSGAHTARIEFRTPRSGAVQARVTGCAIEQVRLQRRVAHWWDSQLLYYLRQLARLDFGVSTATNRRVVDMLKEGIVPSLILTVPIFFAGLVLSVALALVCAFYRNSWLDRSLVLVAVALMSINYLVWIIAGQYFLAYKRGLFPVWGFESWRYLLLPVVIGIISGLGANLRFYRTIMLDELQRDYVRTAFAKGLTTRRVLFKHVLKNAMIPIITNTVIAIPFLYTGSLLLESFFGIPGLGGLSVNAINAADFNVVRAVVLIGAVLYVGANLVSDLCYAAVDPRVKLK